MKEPELEKFELLSRYVITACFRKMNRRFTNISLSKPYFDSLKSVNMNEIEFHESEPKLSWRDKKFFMEFLPIVVLEKAIDVDVPNILEQVRLIKEADKAETVHSGKPAPHLDEQHEHIPLYTKDTYKEFHLLFIHLLTIFQVSLSNLETTANLVFRKNVEVVKLVGTFLQLLAKGDVLKTHLKTIESSLEEHHRVETITVSLPKLNDFKGDEQDEEDEQDEDLLAVQPQAKDDSTQQMPLHVSYSEWLKLMLVYFDAIDVLKRYVNGSRFPFETIDIKILVSPRTSTTLLPWKDIFNSKYLSTHNSTLDEDHFTSDYLLTFFQNAATSNIILCIGYLKQVLRTLKSSEPKINVVKGNLAKVVVESTVPGLNVWAKNLLEELEELNVSSSQPAQPEVFVPIAKAIELMLKGNQLKFFRFLHDVDNKKTPFEFGGTMHCEVCLASLLVHSKVGTIHGYEALRAQLKVGLLFPTCLSSYFYFLLYQGFGRVMGVSKRCCPMCRSLLSLLANDKELPFLVKGSHTTVSACTLPPWLPSNIVDAMNQIFGSRLRKELIKICKSPSTRFRSPSSASRRISSDIGHEGGMGTSVLVPNRSQLENLRDASKNVLQFASKKNL
jgi:hypothetical protein